MKSDEKKCESCGVTDSVVLVAMIDEKGDFRVCSRCWRVQYGDQQRKDIER